MNNKLRLLWIYYMNENRFFSKLLGALAFHKQKKRWHVINKLIKEHGFKHYCEVGVWLGRNAVELRKRNPNLHMVLVDPYDNNIEYTDGTLYDKDDKQYLSEAGRQAMTRTISVNTMFRQLTSKEASKIYPNKYFDIVFIDAIHTYKDLKEDIGLWLPKIRRGGIICGHDYGSRFKGVIRAVHESFGYERVNLEVDKVWWVTV